MDLKFIKTDGKEIKRHDITLAIEVLIEFIAGIKADLGRYMKENKIDKQKDLKNPMTCIHWDLVEMNDSLYKMKTMEEVMSTQNKIIYIRDLVKKLEEN